jgi:hypothetical protein
MPTPSGTSPDSPTGDADDDRLLEVLARTDEPLRPRRWQHFLYFASLESSARQAAASLADAGWEVEILAPIPDSPEWGICAEQDAVITADAIRDARAVMTELVRRYGGEYDGWETII